MKQSLLLFIVDDDDGLESSDNSESTNSSGETMLVAWRFLLKDALAKRYLTRRKYRSHEGANARFKEDLQEDNDSEGESTIPWLNDAEFLAKYRMTKEAFWDLLDKIQDHPVFQAKAKSRKQRPVASQLMLALKALGSEGTAFSKSTLREIFGTGGGTKYTSHLHLG